MDFSRSSLNQILGRKELMNFIVILSATKDYKLVVCAGYWYDEANGTYLDVLNKASSWKRIQANLNKELDVTGVLVK